MASLAELHTALATRLATIDRLRVFAHPPQGASPPIGLVRHTGWTPAAFGQLGFVTAVFEVHMLTAQSVRPQDGYDALLEYADWSGSRSVYQAIWTGNDQATKTFAGLVNTFASVDPEGFRLLGAEEVDAYQMYGGAFAVTVKTKGS
jgi:hypothetical protein